ncbi:hypothetical protein FQN60_004956 [Etheostoma spectabile]|uniref:Uncharacterized protein n=1 Tax=Etheostoma spectabile TaxID=54343 RepID=A0A5J5DLH1_9PERO|nr:hypothetical protein FQN60_004956 [Etheostoma spectabile]
MGSGREGVREKEKDGGGKKKRKSETEAILSPCFGDAGIAVTTPSLTSRMELDQAVGVEHGERRSSPSGVQPPLVLLSLLLEEAGVNEGETLPEMATIAGWSGWITHQRKKGIVETNAQGQI